MAAKHIALGGALGSMFVLAASVCHGQDGHIGTRAFAIVLTQHGVPCGVVAPEVVLAWRPGDPRREATFTTEAPFGSGLPSTLERFNVRNGVFQATQVGGIVHLRSTDEPLEVTAMLEREAPFDTDINAAAGAILPQVAAAVRGGEVRGIIGSGGPLPGPESLLGRRIRLDRGRRSAISILDDVVRQVPGLVWFATYNRGLPSQDLKVGLMERDGTRVALGVSP